jgi:peptidoglycan/LPS O-acetylase OafA/YrhL
VDGETRPSSGRLPAIDLLRAFAIIWVVLFHLWGDLEFFPGAPKEYYAQLGDQVADGAGLSAIGTALSDLFFRDGFQGVPLFMMISGISLTVAAYRAGDTMRWLPFFYHRFRKLMIPYWAGVVITYAVIALIAWRQSAIGTGSFGDQFTGGITISKYSLINVDWEVVRASILLFPRLLDARLFFAPQLALWFVGLLAQYYVLFPVLFWLMRRMGVMPFLLLTFAITVAANWYIIDEYYAPEFKFYLVTGWAPFRIFEFTFGMAIGWLLAAPDRHDALAFIRRPQTIIAALVLGFAAHTAGDLLIGRWEARYWQSLALPLVTLGLGLMFLPFLAKEPSCAERSLPAQALALVGVMSYAILIINDPLRLVLSQMRVEEVSPVVWRTSLALYVPVSILIAWPLSHLLGLMPSRREGTVTATREERRLSREMEERLSAIARANAG